MTLRKLTKARRILEGDGEHFGATDSHQERADEPWRVMDGNGANLVEANPGALEGLLDNRQKPLQVRAR